MKFQNLWNEVMMDFTKCILGIKRCNDHQALFYPAFVDDMCHLSFMLICTREFRHDTFWI